MPERFWFFTLVIGSSLMVVNTGLLGFTESFFSAACTLTVIMAASVKIINFFILLILLFN